MADISFLYDANKKHSDIKIVGGDFLLCDDVVIEATGIESTGIPETITITGTGTAIDYIVVPRLGSNGERPRWYALLDDQYSSVTLQWSNTYDKWELQYFFGAFYQWRHPTSTDILPPKDGWDGSTSGGKPPPTLHYSIPSSLLKNTYVHSSLQVAVETSLFTDRRATTSEIQQFQQGIQERQSRRGFWASTFKQYVQGSALWLLQREKKTNETLSRAKVYCSDALQWLINDGVVDAVNVETSFLGDALIIEIIITKPDGQTAGFKYQFTWDSLEVI